MANTTFSGPVVSQNGFVGNITGTITGGVIGSVTATTLVLPTSTAAAIGAIGNAINTTGKVIGKTVVDLATGLQYTATGTAANSPWKASDGTTSVTPA
jgi:hypothetical protein